MFCYIALAAHLLIAHSLSVSEEVPGLVLEELLEIEALHEAVAEAALLSGEELACLQGQEAALCAL